MVLAFLCVAGAGHLAPTLRKLTILRSGVYREVEVLVTVSMQDRQGNRMGLQAVSGALATALDARYEQSNRISLANPYVLRGSTRDVDGTWTVRSEPPN